MSAVWVGPYRILDKLGAGAMGEVYLADDPRLHRRVALKSVAEKQDRGSADAHKSLLREARAAARLSHANVAAVYDVVESDGQIHIVMEYVQGETLAARLRRGPLPPETVVAIGIELAEALAEAHAMGIIHRDLKPANIMIKPNGSVKVLDFGLARTPPGLGPDPTLSGSDPAHDRGGPAGTPPYVPPEVFRGQLADARGDIYSLGVTLFEMLTGQRPFPGRDMTAVGVAALTEPTPRVRNFKPDVDQRIDDIVARAMHRDPAARLGSAAELADALRHARALLPEAPTESWQSTTSRLVLRHAWLLSLWRGRRRYAWAGLGLVLLLSVLAIVRTRDKNAPVVGHRVEQPPTRDVDALADDTQARAFLDRGDVRANLDRSIALFESAIRRDPRFARAHAGLGRACWRKFEQTRDRAWSEKALLATVEALRLDDGDAAAHQTLGLIYGATGRVPEALEELRRAIALQPTGDEAHARLGQMLFDRGNRDDGIAELKRAIALRPNHWEHHYSLGLCYFDAGRYSEASAAFQRVVELQPDSSRGPYMLGTVALAAGEHELAIEQLRKAIALGPSSSGYTNLGQAFYNERRYAEAAAAFGEAARLAPKSPIKQRNLGDVYARLGRADESKRAYQRAVELCREQLQTNPKDARTLAMLAVYEAKLGRASDALQHAEQAVAIGSAMADVVYRKAVVLALTGQPARSLEALTQALSGGYSRKLAGADEDLAALRAKPEFQVLIGDAKAGPGRGERP